MYIKERKRQIIIQRPSSSLSPKYTLDGMVSAQTSGVITQHHRINNALMVIYHIFTGAASTPPSRKDLLTKGDKHEHTTISTKQQRQQMSTRYTVTVST